MDKKLSVLLRDFCYRFEGTALIEVGIRGYTSDRIVGYFKDVLQAVEFLIPIIREDEFLKRYHEIMSE